MCFPRIIFLYTGYVSLGTEVREAATSSGIHRVKGGRSVKLPVIVNVNQRWYGSGARGGPRTSREGKAYLIITEQNIVMRKPSREEIHISS